MKKVLSLFHALSTWLSSYRFPYIYGGGGNVLMGQTPVMFYDSPTAVSSNNNVYGIPLQIFDDFGNTFSLEQVRQPQQRQQLTCDIGADGLIIGENFDYQVDFDDPEGQGFNAYPVAKEVVCKVLKDVSYLIEAQPDVCNEGAKPVIRIHMLTSFYEYNSEGYALGTASALYYNYSYQYPNSNMRPGIADNSIWKYLNTGQDPTLSPYLNGANYYHGEMFFNFDEQINWNFDYSNSSYTNSFGNPDFYQVVLHEVLHMFGISSLISSNGNSKFNVAYDPTDAGIYSRFDTHLSTLLENDLILNGDGCYYTKFNNAISSLTTACQIKFYDSLVELPIYSPTTWEDAKSLSHFGDPNSCSGPYVMNAAVQDGTAIRKPTDDEVIALCTIGYKTSNTYGFGETLATVPECGEWQAGADDPGCGVPYQFSACDFPITISADELLANDAGATFESDCIDFISPAINATYSSGTITITNAAYGLNILSYIPYSATGEPLNMTYVFFSITPCPEECGISESCNLICNPDIICNDCNLCFVWQFDLSGNPLPVMPLNQCSNLPDWYSILDTPDWYGILPGNPAYNTTKFTLLCGGWVDYTYGEGVGSFSNILPGSYFLSYSVKSSNPPISLHTILTNQENLLLHIANPFYAPTNSEPVPFDVNDLEVSTLNTFQPDFQQVIECLTITSPYEGIYLVPECTYSDPVIISNVSIDRIDLIPNEFPQPLTEINNAECGVSHNIGFIPTCAVNELLYQWQYSPNCDGNWTDIPGATTTNYTTLVIEGEVCRCYRLVRSFAPTILNPGGLCNSTAEYKICPTGCCPPNYNDLGFVLPLSICQNATPIDLTPITTGGVFMVDNVPLSGTIFNPSDFAIGMHTLVYVLSNYTGCPAAVSEPQNILIGPYLSISLIPTPDPCASGTGTVTSNIIGGSSPYTFLWNNGATTPNLANLTAGDYSVTVNDTNGCTASDEVTVTVNELPIADAGTDQNICIGGSSTLTVTGGNTYQWSTNQTTVTITVSPTTNTTYTVTVTDTNDCTASDQVTVTVNPLPIVTISGNTEFCAGSSTELDAGTGYDTYEWSDFSVDQTLIVTAAGTYTVTVTDANNCAASDQVTVTVNTIPNANAGEDQTICAGQSAALTATGGIVYLWSNGQDTDANTVTPTATTTYTITVTDANECTASDQVTVTVNQLPIANAGNDKAICLGMEITLTATGGNTYLWSNGQLSQSITVSPIVTTTYTVTVTDVNGCSTTDDNRKPSARYACYRRFATTILYW